MEIFRTTIVSFVLYGREIRSLIPEENLVYRSKIDKDQHMHFFIQHYISLECWVQY